MLAKQKRPQAQLLHCRPLYETASGSTASDKSNTSRGSQLGLNSNNASAFGSNTQPMAFQYRLSHPAPPPTQNVRKNLIAVNGATGFGNYAYGNVNTARTVQRQNYNTGTGVQAENVPEKQKIEKIAQVNPRNQTGQLLYRQKESNVNYNSKEQKVQEAKKEVVTQPEPEMTANEKTVTEKDKQISLMNQVGTALISNLDSLRVELSRDLEKCKNTDEIQKACLGKINMFDETLKKVLKSHQQFGSQLTRFGGVVEEQFEVILNQFEKASEEIEDANEKIIRKLNTNQTICYKKADKIRKGFASVKKFMKQVISSRAAKPGRRRVRLSSSRKNNTNQQSGQSVQTQNKARENSIVLTKRNPEANKPRELKRANPLGAQMDLGVELPSKQVKTQGILKPCIKNKIEENEGKEINVDKPKLGMTLRTREPKKDP